MKGARSQRHPSTHNSTPPQNCQQSWKRGEKRENKTAARAAEGNPSRKQGGQEAQQAQAGSRSKNSAGGTQQRNTTEPKAEPPTTEGMRDGTLSQACPRGTAPSGYKVKDGSTS